jgi:hypothetical protein
MANKDKDKNKNNTQYLTVGDTRYNVGKNVNAQEFGAIASQNTGKSLQELRDIFADKGKSLNQGAQSYYSQNKNTVNQQSQGQGQGTQPTGIQVTDAQYPWDKYKALEEWKITQQGEFGLESDRIRTASQAEVAKIQAGASNYGYDRQLEGTKYATDSEERWRQAVATIEGDKKASLQNIINAGLKDVAEIEGSYSLKNVEKKGEWDYKTMGLKTEADKDIARMDANQKMYNLLGIAFG